MNRLLSHSNSKKNLLVVNFFRKYGVAYFFLLPWILGMILLNIIPMMTSLYLSFTDYDFFRTPGFIGIRNYIEMFTEDIHYMNSLKVTFKYVFIGVPLQLAFALSLALALNKGIRGLALFRAVYYVPSLLGASVAISVLWRQVFGTEGIVNKFLLMCGIENFASISWVSNPKYSLGTLIILMVWQFGSPMIIFLAGLKQIPQELYESASIDGATARMQFRHITVPILTPIILFNLIMQIISAFKAFTPAFIVGQGTGGALDSILFYTLNLYFEAFDKFRMGYASALAWILLLIISFFTALVFLSSEKWVHYDN